MAQPSIANYFATRKRSAIDEANIVRAKKVLILDTDNDTKSAPRIINRNEEQVQTRNVIYSAVEEKNIKKQTDLAKEIHCDKNMKLTKLNRVVAKLDFDSVKSNSMGCVTAKKSGTPKHKHKKINNQTDIQKILLNMQKNKLSSNIEPKIFTPKENAQNINEKTPPVSPVKCSLEIANKGDLTALNEIKNKLNRSSRLAELKASLTRFNKSAEQLKAAEKTTKALRSQGPALNKFRSIELEIQVSPQKSHSPVKPYLSPVKDVSPRKNLFGMRSPVKSPLASPIKVSAYQKFQTLASPGKPTLTLPYIYRSLAELFRSVDTVCSMLFNRKETITFNKLKPAVQEMTRKNLEEQHFAQIKNIYPDAFSFSREKMRLFASGTRKENYELVIKPNVSLDNQCESIMTPNILLQRRRILFKALIEQVKKYHNEFLLALDPPMNIQPDKLTRWHPGFDIEKIPDIVLSHLPQPPPEEKLTTGQEVLEKARTLFNCNTRMERALENLKKAQENKATETSSTNLSAPSTSTTCAPMSAALKGIPSALLEKIRAKQAAKALDAMTRSSNQDKEFLMYSRLPDIARLMRNTYVAEKKSVLPLEEVIKKLNNSYRSYLTNTEIEQHLRELCKVVPGWLVFHEIRGTLFVKLSRDGDMKRVMAKLEDLAKEKKSL